MALYDMNLIIENSKYLKEMFTYNLEENEILFCLLCRDGLLKEAIWLITKDKRININNHHYCAFRLAFKYNHENIIFWLWNYSIIIKKPIDIHIYNEYPFRKACKNGNLHL